MCTIRVDWIICGVNVSPSKLIRFLGGNDKNTKRFPDQKCCLIMLKSWLLLRAITNLNGFQFICKSLNFISESAFYSWKPILLNKYCLFSFGFCFINLALSLSFCISVGWINFSCIVLTVWKLLFPLWLLARLRIIQLLFKRLFWGQHEV